VESVQEKFVLSCETKPPDPANKIEFAVRDEKVGADENVFDPAKVCVPVLTVPSAVADASGKFIVIVPPRDTGEPLTLNPVPLEPTATEMAEFCKFAFGIPVGKSATTKERKEGVPLLPLGAAKIEFAASDASVTAKDPEPVMGDPETEKIDGIANPTLDTTPLFEKSCPTAFAV